MFGVGPTELAFFLVILLLVVGPDKLPTFMRTVGKGLRQVRGASREFKDAIGFDELMREGDPFRAPPVKPPVARPLPRQSSTDPSDSTEAAATPNLAAKTPPPPPPDSLRAKAPEEEPSEPPTESGAEPKHP